MKANLKKQNEIYIKKFACYQLDTNIACSLCSKDGHFEIIASLKTDPHIFDQLM